jgi:RsiW-degrading membrane proteinase PrsW (M82 family)
VNELQVSCEGRRYQFEQGRTVRIGRSTDNDVVVSDPTVSRQHARLAWGPDGWTFEGLGRAGTFLCGSEVTRLLVAEPVELSLASPLGPVLRLEPPPRPAGPAVTLDEGGPAAGADGSAVAASAVPEGTNGHGAPAPAGTADPGAPFRPAGPAAPFPPAGWGAGAAPPGMAASGGSAAAPPATGGPGTGQAGPFPTAAMPRSPVPPRLGGAAAEAADELASAVQILVPVRSWLKDPGWRQGLRLLVIPYALLPLVFLALFASSGNLTTPGWAYSLYIAPLWGVAFWLLIRPPGGQGKQEVLIGLGIVIWVMLWMSIVTVSVNSALNPKGLAGALLVGFNEEVTKALPILVAALALLKLRSVKLDVRMWMFFGTIAGLTFGVREASQYTTLAIERIAAAAVHHSANSAVVGALSFAYRVFVDGFQHAIWAGVAAFFIGIAVNYPRRRVPLILFGVAIAAVLHALNDWYLSNFDSPWPWILLQAFSLLLFLGYTMSAASIERKVRRTPLFRGESMIMDKFTETGEHPRA